MEIRNKSQHDPMTELYAVDAYMRWALQAAEEVVGVKGLEIVLRQVDLERLIQNYPPNELKASGNFTFGDYSNLCAGLLNFFGRAGKSMTIRIGRISAKHAIEQQKAVFGIAALVGAKFLPVPTQLKMGMATMQNGFIKMSQSVGQTLHLRLEDRGDKIAYIAEECAFCAGKECSEPMCWVFNGTLQEAVSWQTGKEFDIVEVACRAMGAPACVWEVSKMPKT